MGAVLAPVRGRVLTPPRAIATGGRGAFVLLALVLVLPLFGETFTYVVDLPPAYALAKVWPFLVLPLTVAGAVALKLPGRSLIVATLAWMAAVTPLISMATLGDSLGGALTGSIKIWPLGGALALGTVLAWLKPTPVQVERALHVLGFSTFALMALIWLLAPPEAYNQGIATTKVFLSDPERGFRLNMPMFFGLLWLFLLGRRFWDQPRILTAVLIAAAFGLMLLIYKQRTQIGGAAAVITLAPLLRAAHRRGAWFGVLAGGALAAAPFLYLLSQSHDAAASLGGSLTARQVELGHALAFLNDHPLRWLVGAGGATRAGDVDLAAIVGTNYFFLSDLGWLGVVFEYGAVGALLMLALQLTALTRGWRAASAGSPLAWGLFDYALFMLLVSPVISVVFAPAELATCLALLGYGSFGRTGPIPTIRPAGR